MSRLLSSGLFCLFLLVTFPALSHAKAPIPSSQTSQELPAEAKDIRIIDEFGNEISVSTEDIRSRLINGNSLHFVKDQKEVKRTVGAYWITKALKNNKPVDIKNAIIVGDLDLRVGEKVSIDDSKLESVLEQWRISELKELEVENVYLVSSPISIVHSILKGKLLAGWGKKRIGIVVFQGKTNFNKTEFSGEINNFIEATFSKEADFQGATFLEKANFSMATFSKEADFQGATFLEEANFFRATFSKEANFSVATFSEEAYFFRATFSKEANFVGATFSKEANFQGATFLEKADFQGATFSEEANFVGATFSKEANFEWAPFSKEANFVGATFSEAYFGGATFLEEANFFRATFSKVAYFQGATFSKEANFSDATFSEAYFGGATFSANTDFTNSRFRDVVRFNGAVFKNSVDFHEATFDKDVLFPKADFAENINVDLRDTIYTHLRISWPQLKGRLDAPLQKLLDTLEAGKKAEADEFIQWEEVYRRLITNFEDIGDRASAHDAYYHFRLTKPYINTAGSAEKYVEGHRWLQKTKRGAEYVFFGLTCGYGVKPLRPLLVGGLLIGVFTLIYFSRKTSLEYEIREKDKKKGRYKKVHFSEMPWYRRLGNCLYFSVSSFATVGFGRISPRGYFKVAAMSESVLGWFTLALFLATLANVLLR